MAWYRRTDDKIDDLISRNTFAYRAGMETVDEHRVNQIGRARFEQVKIAQERGTRANRLARRLRLVRSA